MPKVLVASKTIIWGEYTMANKRALDALNWTLEDVSNDSRCFGGALILMSGDIRLYKRDKQSAAVLTFKENKELRELKAS